MLVFCVGIIIESSVWQGNWTNHESSLRTIEKLVD